jgi:uncharacterized membrane protein YfcA
VDPHLLLVAAGLVVGVLYGLFGVGSAFATPVLALLGVPGAIAMAAPLPGLLPGSMAGAWSYARGRRVDWGLARCTIAGGLPGTIIGALAASLVGGQALLILSGVVLAAVGVRVLRPASPNAADAARARRERRELVIGAAFVVGFAAGLLSNGGGFLLVPLFLVGFGLSMNEAAGTSMVCVAALSIPAAITHAAVGDIDWAVALLFGLGMAPGALAGARLAQHLPAERLRRSFGALLVVFAVWFVARQL